MTQPPFQPPPMSPPPTPLGYQGPTPAVQLRPTSVTVLAIIGIILSGLGVLCGPFALLPYVTTMGPPNPIVDAVKKAHALMVWMFGSSLLSWLVSLLLLICAIGSLLLKRWARSGMLVYAIISIAMGLIGLVVSITWAFPAMQRAISGAGGSTGGLIGGLIGGVLGLIYPVFVLVYMRKPHVIEAFERGLPPSGAGFRP